MTFVILVLEDTFDDAAISGEAPPGLRANDIDGDGSIEGVPDGDPGGSDPVEVAYDGPLESGMIYPFRATSMKSEMPLSVTEDLKGALQVE